MSKEQLSLNASPITEDLGWVELESQCHSGRRTLLQITVNRVPDAERCLKISGACLRQQPPIHYSLSRLAGSSVLAKVCKRMPGNMCTNAVLEGSKRHGAI